MPQEPNVPALHNKAIKTPPIKEVTITEEIAQESKQTKTGVRLRNTFSCTVEMKTLEKENGIRKKERSAATELPRRAWGSKMKK